MQAVFKIRQGPRLRSAAGWYVGRPGSLLSHLCYAGLEVIGHSWAGLLGVFPAVQYAPWLQGFSD